MHANRARKHLAKQSEGLERDLQSDRKLAQTLRLIEQVDNPSLRDRLKSVVAMRVLDLNPDPDVITKRLLVEGRQASRKSIRLVMKISSVSHVWACESQESQLLCDRTLLPRPRTRGE